MLTKHNRPEFSEDPLSIYRRDLIATKVKDYQIAVTDLHNLGPLPYLVAMAEHRHADLVIATLPPSAERDEWHDKMLTSLHAARAAKEDDS